MNLLAQLNAAHQQLVVPPYAHRNASHKLTNAQLAANIRLREQARASLEQRTTARYKAAFGGQPRTISELQDKLKLLRQSIAAYLKNLIARGLVRREAGKRNREYVYSWI